MHAQIRVTQLRAARGVSLASRRLLATPSTPSTPSTTGTPLPSQTVLLTTPGSSTLARPVIPPTASGSLPPPPPPPPRPPRRLFRRFLIYTTLGALTFYPLSGWLGTKSETYREFFTTNFPGGEFVADYADDHRWESFGYGTVSKSALQGLMKVSGEDKTAQSTRESNAERLREVQRSLEGAGRKAETETKKAVQELEDRAKDAAGKIKSAAGKAKDAISPRPAPPVTLPERAAAATRGAAEQVKEAVTPSPPTLPERAAAAARDGAERVKDAITPPPVTLPERAVAATREVADKAKALASDAKAKVTEAASSTPFNFSEGIEGIVREAEKALNKGESKIEDAAQRTKEKIEATPGPQGYLDTQRPRELRPETVGPKKPSFEGKQLYAGPALPLGFEPPPGTYIPPPIVEKVKEGVEKVKETLPLLGPKVKEFAASEPIISQLASTIDSLTSSLSTPSSADAKGILTKAHDDLSALSKRLDDVKKTEKERLERTVGEKTKEFEAILKSKAQEREQGEQGLKESWEKERGQLVDDWRKSLEGELESQREGIEKRLREEVVSQGIELQRRWLRSIKSQVETERGGRLAKLDHLTTSLKQLERITLDNSATLDDNVRLHKVWSALRAVQAKAESGDAAFDEELRLLRTLSAPPDQSSSSSDSVVLTTLNQLEQSGIAQTGVKSFAQLSSWFTNTVSPRIHSASLVPAPENAGVLSHLASATVSKLMFTPKAGLVEGDDVSSVLARAEWCLGEKDLDGAAREINSLKGWPSKLARDWLREARRRLEVQQALEIVGAEATLGSLLLV